VFLAGGQSLIPMLNLRLVDAGVLIDISRVAELDGIREVDGKIEIGGRSHAEQADGVGRRWPKSCRFSPWRCPSSAIPDRNKGTVCGSRRACRSELGNSAPLLALAGGEVVLRSKHGERVLMAGRFSAGHADHGTRGRRADYRVRFSGHGRTWRRLSRSGAAGTATLPSSPLQR